MNQFSIGSDNGLSPIRRQAIILSKAGLFSIGPLGTNFSEIRIEMQNFSFTKIYLKRKSRLLNRGHFVQGGDELSYCISTLYLWHAVVHGQ